MLKSWLYIPIETKVRELQGKILLASFATMKDFNVVIGPKADINSKSRFFPKGIVFNVGLAKNLSKNSQKFKKYGHKVAAIDEEGIVTLNDDLYVKHRVSKETLDVTDIFFCWGNRQASLIKKEAEKTNCKIFVTGNPRFDILRPEYRFIFDKDVDKIRKKYGKFILINTNFGHGNHFGGDNFLLESFKEKGWLDDHKDKSFFLKNIEWQKKMLKEFQKIIPELSKKFKNHNIIIRPHPSENHDFWKKIAKNYDNVSVVYSGNVTPWLIATDVLIHNGCTTAVEAFILRSKTISFRPFVIEEQETKLPNKISAEAYNLQELINLVEKFINKKEIKENYESKKKYLNYFLSGIDDKTASEQISFNLATIARSNQDKIKIFQLLLFEFFEHILFMLRKIMFKKKKGYISTAYQLHKNPGIFKNEIQEIIEKLSRVNNKFKNIKVKRISINLYQIYGDK